MAGRNCFLVVVEGQGCCFPCWYALSGPSGAHDGCLCDIGGTGDREGPGVLKSDTKEPRGRSG